MTVTGKATMIDGVVAGDNDDGTGAGRAGDEVISDTELDALMTRAQTDGVELLGDGGLLAGLTKRILERAMSDELTCPFCRSRWEYEAPKTQKLNVAPVVIPDTRGASGYRNVRDQLDYD